MVDVPEAILDKKGALTPEGLALVKRHTDLGRAILGGSGQPWLEDAAGLAWSHHELWDGTGYPRGLRGDAIPRGARILCVADVFDALTTRRPFKEAYPVDVAFDIVRARAGTHFDPAVVEALVAGRAAVERVHRERSAPDRVIAFRISDRDTQGPDVADIARDACFTCPYCREFHPRDQERCPASKRVILDIHKLSGTVLDEKYHLQAPLGVGGMGVVYEAIHVLIGRCLAIKVVNAGSYPDRSHLARFYQEARVFADVGHPNLVEVTDMGRTPDGVPYFVMERLRGRDLGRVLQEVDRLPWIAGVSVAIEVLRTLAAVHARGIVHRDMKPENVFLEAREGGLGLKLLDFGVSRLVAEGDDDGRLTRPGMIFGTPQYMSPEQADGAADVDPRADLFTTGEILYEMLTGRPPFTGRTAQAILAALARGTFVPPSRAVPGVPPQLDAVLARALARDRDARFPDAGSFAAALVPLARTDPRWREGALVGVPGG